MTAPEVRAWIEANLERKKVEFGLGNWRLQTFFERKSCHDDGFQPLMSATCRPEYERLAVRVDDGACADLMNPAELEETCEHELMHAVHSPFNMYRAVVWPMLNDDQRAVSEEAYRHAEEMTVRNMERMAAGLRDAAKNANPTS